MSLYYIRKCDTLLNLIEINFIGDPSDAQVPGDNEDASLSENEQDGTYIGKQAF